MQTQRPVYYLHVGAPKTGTTFIQSMLREHRTALADDGVLFPKLGKYGRFLAALDGRDKHSYRGRTYDASGYWQRLVDRTHDFVGAVVFSHELLGFPRGEGTPTAIRALDGYETHIVVTARDPGRQLPSCWQQRLKHGHTTTFAEYVAALDPDADTATGLFADQRLDRILERWAEHVPPERLHVLTVPPPGAEAGVLWERFCTLVGADASRYPVPQTARPNTSLGIAQIEQLRRVNAVAAERLDAEQRRRLVRMLYARRVLPATSLSARPALPRYAADLAAHLAANWISAIERHGVDVVGDPEDLRPGPPGDSDPDVADPDEVLTVGAQAAVELLLTYAKDTRSES